MSSPVNFQSLVVDKKYTVLAYTMKSKFDNNYILKVADENNEIFQIWSTPSLTNHITDQLCFDGKKFCFTVRKMQHGVLKPEIEGKQKMWVELQ